EGGDAWAPWSDMFSEIQDAVSGLADGALRGVVPGSGRFPRYDFVELADGGYRLLLDLPGLEKGDVDVSVANRELVISGERARPELPVGAEIQRSERIYGRFRRAIRIPGDVDSSAISAKMRDGVLDVLLPLSAADAQSIRVE
ncbi:MAG: Hsp20/alpha crystallin family protein, partial [Gemmatimonadetes bacterium]|nr:Hsp20/alpha crystallin family protein [Gemmatimonadota bacterium]